MKASLILAAVAVLSSSVVAAPAPMHPPGSLRQRWRWTDWADADSTEEGVPARRNPGDAIVEKRWAWTKWEDAVDAPAEKKAKRWAWTKWEDAVDAPVTEAQ